MQSRFGGDSEFPSDTSVMHHHACGAAFHLERLGETNGCAIGGGAPCTEDHTGRPMHPFSEVEKKFGITLRSHRMPVATYGQITVANLTRNTDDGNLMPRVDQRCRGCKISNGCAESDASQTRMLTREFVLGAHPVVDRELIESLAQGIDRIGVDTNTGGHRMEAAQWLGWGRNTLTRKIQELKLDTGKH